MVDGRWWYKISKTDWPMGDKWVYIYIMYLHKCQLSRFDVAQNNYDLPYHVAFSLEQNAPLDLDSCGRMHWPKILPLTLHHVDKRLHNYCLVMQLYMFSPVRHVNSSMNGGNKVRKKKNVK